MSKFPKPNNEIQRFKLRTNYQKKILFYNFHKSEFKNHKKYQKTY